MTAAPVFEFRVGQPAELITPQNPQWTQPLPSDRRDFLPEAGRPAPLPGVSYGDFFLCVRDFLINNFDVLNRAMRTSGPDRVHSDQPQKIVIDLVKHGAFYHPARVTFHGTSEMAAPALVLNVAVSAAGQKILAREYRALKRLQTEFALDFTPEVYVRGTGCLAGRQGLEMFAGQWLSGFCEFHLGAAGQNGRLKWFAWEKGLRCALSDDQVSSIYRQAMLILTSYYNPLTFAAVLDWHPAAGDFVVKQGAGDVAVRLITVRRYAPMLNLSADEPVNSQAVLDGLVVFLLGTSMRMRLDRLDGVGEPVWADNRVVAGIWQGFKQGLEQITARWELPVGFDRAVTQYLAGHSPYDLLQVGQAVLARHAGAADEAALLAGRLADHVALLSDRIAGE